VNRLLKLNEYGQSYWLDNLTRKKITSGELKKRIEEQGLRGVTSNPTIFDKAIAKSQDYDTQIEELAKKGVDPLHIYDQLVIKDIQDACDVMRPVFDKTHGLDGYISLEVSPHLAHNPEETAQETRRLFKTVNRPNCLIKIPGTKEAIPVIEQMLYEGININITLLFSVKMYEQVANAYVSALEKRVKENKPIDMIASVASFFLSRIDVLVDKLLEQKQDAKNLLGKIAIANAKMAYQSFKTIFQGKRWEELAKKGAKVQRPLWASTSTKNPNYLDVMYVEPLIGKDTVNTMPDETIEAFADHGKAAAQIIEQDIDKAKEDLNNLKKAGIDLEAVTDQLTKEGIQKFIEPYDALLKTIQEKMHAFKK